MSQNQTTNAGTTALAFNSFTFDVILRDGKQWLRSSQIAEALGYAQTNRTNDLYNRYSDEFTDSMTALVKLPDLHPQVADAAPASKNESKGQPSKPETTGQTREVRVFSLRGAHLLGMFARTDVAKAFRRWVLDVLDREVEQQIAAAVAAMQTSANDYTRISPAQAQALKELVIDETQRTGKHYKTIWGAFNRHFQVNTYTQLPASQFDEACKWLGGKRIATKAAPAPSYELPPVDFDFMRTMNDGLCDPKPINSAVRAVAQQMSWKLAAEAQVGILQFLERFISYRTNEAGRQDVSCVAPMLEKLTLSHCLAYRYFEELDRARQMAGLMQQMANTCVNSIQQRMGTVFA